MEEPRLKNEIEYHWRLAFEEKSSLFKGGYSVEVSGSDGKKVLW